MRRQDLGSQSAARDNLRRQTAGCVGEFLYLTSFLQNGRNHTALEVPAGVVVLLRIVRRNRRPELGLQLLIVAGHGAQGHPIQDEALLQPHGILAQVHHPNHRSLQGPRWWEWEAQAGGSPAHCYVVSGPLRHKPHCPHPTGWALRAVGEVACWAQGDEQEEAMQEIEGEKGLLNVGL